MEFKRSLGRKLAVGFAVITVPLLLILVSNNLYAMNVVRSQAAQSNKNLIAMYMGQIDQSLLQISKQLYNLANSDPNLGTLSVSDSDSEEYYFAKMRALTKISSDLNYYNEAKLFFVYDKTAHELIYSPLNVTYNRRLLMLSTLQGYIDRTNSPQLLWTAVPYGNEYALIRVVPTNYSDIVVGAWIDIDRLAAPLSAVDFGGQGKAVFVSDRGAQLNLQDGLQVSAEGWMKTIRSRELYELVDNGTQKWIAVSETSANAAMKLVVVAPEQAYLRQLPSFQRIIWLASVASVVFVFLYLLFVRKVFLGPIMDLVNGMRKIRQGQLGYRMPQARSEEFILLSHSFNEMVDQIHDLRINVYEEQINVQSAKLKQLQAQINPHFFLNSLNIIYNLSQVGKSEIVQKMVMHLVHYFRFITRTTQSLIPLREELAHVRNYLEIQQLRFPLNVQFDIELPEVLEGCLIPPLVVQPLVENCMVHGFKKGTDIFRIRIAAMDVACHPGERYLIVVEDNGVGFTEDKLAMLNLDQNSLAEDDQHLGISNTLHRLSIRFPGVSSMRFANREDGGARIEICLEKRGADPHE